MNIESTLGKFLNPVEKHSAVLGAAIALADPFNWQEYLNDIGLIVTGKGHAPEWANIVNSLAINDNFKTGVIAAIIGWLLDGNTGNSTINSIATILKRGGTAWAAVYAGRDVLYFSTHSDTLFQNMGIGQQPASINPTAGSLYTKAAGQRPIGIQW